MTEHETDPQRHDTPSTEPTHRPADASHESSSSPERGQSAESHGEEPTAQQPVVPQPPAAPYPPAGPQPPAAPYPPAGPTAPHSVAPPPWNASPWQQPQQQPPQQQTPHSQQPTPHPQQQAPQHPYQPQTLQQPAYAGGYGGEQPPPAPPWAQPVGNQPPRDPARSRRRRNIFLAAVAAVVIALGAGGVGAAAALAFDDDTPSAAVKTGDAAVTRTVDRSSLAQIASAVQDSVVSITTQSGEGSGVVLSADGFVLTNNHVVASAQGGKVNVVFADGKKATATIVGTDPRTDLAVVKADGVSGLKAATFGDSAKMQVGDTVLALGSPLGLEGSVTAGIISAKDRTIRSGGEGDGQQGQPQQQQQQGATSMSGLLQTDAPINPGNSGGALVNISGEVIGINSAIATSGGNNGNIGLGFAIPSAKATQVAKDLMDGKKVSHPALGVSVAEAEGGGALVSAVSAGSGAAKAGLQRGDLITSVNGKPINDSDDLVGVVQSGTVGQTLTIIFTRDGAQKTVTATLAEAS